MPRVISSVIVCKGRVGDRKMATRGGAIATGDILARLSGQTPDIIGDETAPITDGWEDALSSADATLRLLQQTTSLAISRGVGLTAIASSTCSASIATLPAIASAYPDIVVLWVDAHGDFNTPATTRSGYLGGMALSGPCGLWQTGHGGEISPGRVVVIAARDVDEEERLTLREHGITMLTADQAVAGALGRFIGGRPVWLHIDWDVMEPGLIPADFSVPGGLDVETLCAIVASLSDDRLVGLELTEYQPPEDQQGRKAAERRITRVIEACLGMNEV